MKPLRLLSVAAAVAVGITLPASAASAATTRPTRELITPTVSITTTTGVVVHLQVDADHESTGTTVDVALDNRKSGFTLFEGHDWTFDVTSGVMTYKSGSGTLATGSQFGPYGSVNIQFTKASQTSTSCKNDSGVATSVTKVKVALKGVIAFNAKSSSTKASHWGNVRKGTASARYHFGGLYGHYISTTNGTCRVPTGPNGTMPCLNGTDWNAPFIAAGTSFQFVGGGNSSAPTAIQAFRERPLSSPGNAERIDIVVAPAPAPVFDATGGAAGDGQVAVSTKTGSAAGGSATLSATGPGSVALTSPCSNGSTTATQNETDYTADFTNDPNAPLVVQSAVGAAFTVADAPASSSNPAGFSVYSSS